ncbi:MAG: ABC transporter ATP-binding protein [Ilumatobacteraceae bacterium]|jgi:putative spermidine/putrescine transport system ATP-binding protein|nr:ABC transporter ATP-binding protein [Ilumatobacteraceae bacterium]
MSALEFANVSKSFGDVNALINFSIALEQGELVSLLGPSGCGKTTALRIAAGFETADTGSILLGSTNIIGLPAHERRMGMVFQSYSLFPHLNIRDNVSFGLRVRGVRNEARKKRADEMLDLVRLSDLGHRMPHQISGGQQQRVALARALAAEPHVLLLDEPLSALDAKIRVEVRDEIRRLNRDLGVTTMFVTHDQDEAMSISDRICVMNSGVIEQVGSPRDVYDNPASSFVAHFVGSINSLPKGNTQTLIRPENLVLTTHDQNAQWRGAITDITFVGAFTKISVRLENDDAPISVLAISTQIDHNIAIGLNIGINEAAQ